MPRLRSARPWREGSSLASLVGDVQATLSSHARAPPGHAFTATAAGTSSSGGPLISSGPNAVAGLMRSLSLDGADACAARLAALPNAELLACLTDTDAFHAVLSRAAAESEAAAVAAQLRESNAAAASANLALAAEAADIRTAIAIVRSTDFASAKARYDAAAARQAALRERTSVAALVKQLAEGAAADERASDQAEQQLLSGDLAPEAFVKTYKALRLRYHTRELKRAQAAV